MKSYWERKEERKQKALAHTREMQEKYASEIAESVRNTRIYGEGFQYDRVGDDSAPIVGLSDNDSVSALFEDTTIGKVALLNFASYRNPGGNFLGGSSAQEEALCHESFLYNVLSEMKEYYAYNGEHRNRSLYTNRALYTPGVVFGHDGRQKSCDVLTCASPNLKAAREHYNVTPAENEQVLRERIHFIKEVLEDNGPETAILGAFGCGAFGQDARIVAKIMLEEFARTKNIRKIVYAVPAKIDQNNYNAFKRLLKS